MSMSISYSMKLGFGIIDKTSSSPPPAPTPPTFLVNPSISPSSGARGQVFSFNAGNWSGTSPIVSVQSVVHSVLGDVTDQLVGGEYDSEGVALGTLTFTVELSNAATGGTPVVETAVATITAAVPDAPVVTLDDTSDEGFTLSWVFSDNGGATVTQSDIQYRIPPSGSPVNVSDVTSPYEQTGLTDDTTYQYQVRGQNSAGWGEWSDWANVTTDVALTVPEQPDPPVDSDLGEDTVTLSWTAPSDGGSVITSYTLEWRETGGSTNTITDATSPEVLTGLEPGTAHQARVTAINAIGSSTPSDWTDFETNEASVPARTTLALSDDLVWSTHSLLVTARGPEHGGDLYQYWTGNDPYVFAGFSSLKDRWDADGIDVTFTTTDGMIVTEIADLGTGTYAPDSTQGIETLQYLYWFAKNAQDKGCQLFVLYPPWSTAAMDTTYDDDTMAKWQYMTDWLISQPDITMDVALFPTPYIVRAFRDYYDPASIFGDGLHMTETTIDSTMQSPFGMSRAVEMLLTGVKSTRLDGGAHVTNLIDLAWDLLQGPSGYACAGLGGALTVTPYAPAGGDPLPSPLPLS